MNADLCAVCHHTHEFQPGRCPQCGCYGFFREGARYCDNTECQGTNCTEARRQEAEDRARHDKETSR